MRRLRIFLVLVMLHVMLFAQNQPIKPRYRVIIDNDFAGDPDGLFHLVHQLLCQTTEIRGIIGSAHYPVYPPLKDPCASAVEEVNKLLLLMGLQDNYRVFKGSNEKMTLDRPADCEGARAIIAEAMRNDTKLPLFILCGASLKTVASAYLIEPAIADKITIIWIGGMEHEMPMRNIEYNLNISIPAAQVIFNKSKIPLWQVPRDTYRQAMMSVAELKTRVATKGKLGEYLFSKITKLMSDLTPNLGSGDTYVLGDSPLALLSALQTYYEPDASSSHFILRKAPLISDDGSFKDNPDGRQIRVFTNIDNRLMFEDFIAKLSVFQQ